MLWSKDWFGSYWKYGWLPETFLCECGCSCWRWSVAVAYVPEGKFKVTICFNVRVGVIPVFREKRNSKWNGEKSFDKGLKFRSMTLPDIFIEQDDPKKMYELAGLNSSQISKKILDVLFTKDSIKVVKN